MPPKTPAGVTLAELLVVIAIASLLLGVTGGLSLPALSREPVASAVYDVRTMVQLARIEAIRRGSDCRFVVDSAERSLRVLDGRDTVVYETRLPTSASFARPDGGPTITLRPVAGSEFETVFSPDGTVLDGDGEIWLAGAGRYARVSVRADGSVRVERRDESDPFPVPHSSSAAS